MSAPTLPLISKYWRDSFDTTGADGELFTFEPGYLITLGML